MYVLMLVMGCWGRRVRGRDGCAGSLNVEVYRSVVYGMLQVVGHLCGCRTSYAVGGLLGVL